MRGSTGRDAELTLTLTLTLTLALTPTLTLTLTLTPYPNPNPNQDETRRAALPQPVLIAARAEFAAQRKVSLQDVEVCCHLALRGEG